MGIELLRDQSGDVVWARSAGKTQLEIESIGELVRSHEVETTPLQVVDEESSLAAQRTITTGLVQESGRIGRTRVGWGHAIERRFPRSESEQEAREWGQRPTTAHDRLTNRSVLTSSSKRRSGPTVPTSARTVPRPGPKVQVMCRNITTLRGLEPVATAEEIEAAARQYVRKVTGVQQTSAVTEAAFERAVAIIADATDRVLGELPPRKAPPKTEPPLRRLARSRPATP